MLGGYRYFDALTDDARLVYRVIREGVLLGGTALNYAKVENLLRSREGLVAGVLLRDVNPKAEGQYKEIRSTLVINATGAWVNEVRDLGTLGGDQKTKFFKLRNLRGCDMSSENCTFAFQN